MKKNNGFTLIELLAIIVILAIIAVITVPIILNIIENAQIGAAKDSAYGYKDAINKFYVSKLSQDKDFEFTDGTYTKAQLKTMGVSISGQEPEDNSWVSIYDNVVVDGCIQFGEYKVEIVNEKLGQVTKGQCETLHTQYNSGDIVKYDPVANSKCTDGSTCYTWNVITVGDSKTNNKITMQMDHNLVDTPWISPGDYTDQQNLTADGEGRPNKGPITAFKALATATSTWDDSLLLNYTYDTSLATTVGYGVLTCTNGTCVNGDEETIVTNLKARFITGEEISALTKNAGATDGSLADLWTLATNNDGGYYFSNSNRTIGTIETVSGTGDTSLSWLVQNTYPNKASGATANSYGANSYYYWTLSPQVNTNYMIWCIGNTGNIGYCRAYEKKGVRPVISVSKTVLE